MFVEPEPCDNCGTFHTFGKLAGCESRVPSCSVHPDTKPRELHNEEGFFLGYECPECVCPICGLGSCRCQYDCVK